jgi:CDP-archaeol synthase
LGAPWTGLPSTAGLLVSAMAMIGDLLSSFVKRRMKLVPGSMAFALDQIPESLLPAIAARWVLPVSVLDIIFVTGLFSSVAQPSREFLMVAFPVMNGGDCAAAAVINPPTRLTAKIVLPRQDPEKLRRAVIMSYSAYAVACVTSNP